MLHPFSLLNPTGLLCCALLLGCSTPIGFAQTAPKVTPPTPFALVAGDAVVLSPFTVSTDRDSGFVAASSLAGGRLATDLKDTPVAYSVITRDFIDALGLTNAFEAASWSPNTVISIASNGGGVGDDVSGSPGSYNVRGAGGGRGQRNFSLIIHPTTAMRWNVSILAVAPTRFFLAMVRSVVSRRR